MAARLTRAWATSRAATGQEAPWARARNSPASSGAGAADRDGQQHRGGVPGVGQHEHRERGGGGVVAAGPRGPFQPVPIAEPPVQAEQHQVGEDADGRQVHQDEEHRDELVAARPRHPRSGGRRQGAGPSGGSAAPRRSAPPTAGRPRRRATGRWRCRVGRRSRRGRDGREARAPPPSGSPRPTRRRARNPGRSAARRAAPARRRRAGRRTACPAVGRGTTG